MTGRKEAEIAAASRTVGVLIGHLGKVGASGQRALSGFDGGAGSGLVRLLVHIPDDMRRVDGLRRNELLAMLDVVVAHVLRLRRRDFGRHALHQSIDSQPHLEFTPQRFVIHRRDDARLRGALRANRVEEFFQTLRRHGLGIG